MSNLLIIVYTTHFSSIPTLCAGSVRFVLLNVSNNLIQMLILYNVIASYNSLIQTNNSF